MTLRLLCAPLILLAMLLHLLWGTIFAVLVFPLLPMPARDALVRFWSRVLLVILRIRLDARVAPDASPVVGRHGALMLANHISWADVFVITAMVPVRFVAKAEIARWPLLGRFAAGVGTVFVERGRRHAVAHVNDTVIRRLRGGQGICIFPEGTTTDGTHLLPFHANLVQAAIDAPSPVVPLALQYRRDGRPTVAPAFIGEMTLVASIWNIVSTPGLSVHLTWLPSLDSAGRTRHALGAAARDAIAATLGLPEDPPPQPGSPHVPARERQ